MGIGSSQHDPHHVKGSGLPLRSSIAVSRHPPLRLFENATMTPRIPYSLDSHCKFRMMIRTLIYISSKKKTGCASVVDFGKKVAQRHSGALTKGSPKMVFLSRDSGGTLYPNNWGLSCPANDQRPSGTDPRPSPSPSLSQMFLVTTPELHLSHPWRARIDETVHFFSNYYEMKGASYETADIEISFQPKSWMISEDYKRIAQTIAHFEQVLEVAFYTFSSRGPPNGGPIVLPTFIPSLNKYVAGNSARVVRTIRDIRYRLKQNKQIDFTAENQLFPVDGRWYCTDFLRRNENGESVCLKVGWRVPIQIEASGFAAAWLVGFVGAAITCKSVAQLWKFDRTLDGLTEFIECSARGWTNLQPRHVVPEAEGR